MWMFIVNGLSFAAEIRIAFQRNLGWCERPGAVGGYLTGTWAHVPGPARTRSYATQYVSAATAPTTLRTAVTVFVFWESLPGKSFPAEGGLPPASSSFRLEAARLSRCRQRATYATCLFTVQGLSR